jgi:Skp family chaperone for outer membrane proteins
MQQGKAAEVRDKQQLLESTRQQLAAATDADLRTKLQQQELQQRTDLERATVQAQSDLQAAQRNMQAGLQAKLKPILEDMLKDQDVSLVLNAESGVVWSAPGLDLTPAVIERWNARTAAGAQK